MKPAALRLPKTHRVKKKLSGGRVAIYWYRSRGGPLLHRFEGASFREALAAEAAGASAVAAAYATPSHQPTKTTSMAELVTAYRSAPDGFIALADSTRREWGRYLNDILAEFGDLPVKALTAKGVRTKFIEWRNSRASTPRKADYGIQVLSRLLNWAVDNERAECNPAQGIKQLTKSSRADKVVEAQELDAILARITPQAARLIRLAAATGIRRGDLVKLKWSDVGVVSIEFGTSKSNGRSRPIVPILPEARTVLDECERDRNRLIEEGRVPSAFVLTTAHGGPWKENSATQAFWRPAKELGIDKNLHDLRGTAVTRYILAGLSDVQVAELVGWEPTRVSQVRRRYVDRDRIAQGVIEQLERAERNR